MHTHTHKEDFQPACIQNFERFNTEKNVQKTQFEILHSQCPWNKVNVINQNLWRGKFNNEAATMQYTSYPVSNKSKQNKKKGQIACVSWVQAKVKLTNFCII